MLQMPSAFDQAIVNAEKKLFENLIDAKRNPLDKLDDINEYLDVIENSEAVEHASKSFEKFHKQIDDAMDYNEERLKWKESMHDPDHEKKMKEF